MSASQANTTGTVTHIGVVVIGRNEGPRLGSAFRSIDARSTVIYVDSGSTDASLGVALEHGVETLSLDPSRAFSAARARNEGYARLRQRLPTVQFVQFLDGDCTLAPGWLQAAAVALREQERCAIVMGKLFERNPQASVYNHLCALELDAPVGDLKEWGAIGGIMAVRATAFSALGGFREEIVAGEDSEFGVRVGLAGFKITRLADTMATHDADMHRFGQWWRRSVRAGHAIGQRAALNGHTAARDCVRERRSTLAWGVALPAICLVLAWPTNGASLLLVAAANSILVWRIAAYRRRLGESLSDAWLYARYTVLAKLANAVGLLSFFLAQARGQIRIIEYK